MKSLKVKLAQIAQSNAARGLTAAAVTALSASGARAEGTTFTVDTTGIVSVITGGVTTISSIGIAVLSLVVVIKLFKWAQRVL